MDYRVLIHILSKGTLENPPRIWQYNIFSLLTEHNFYLKGNDWNYEESCFYMRNGGGTCTCERLSVAHMRHLNRQITPLTVMMEVLCLKNKLRKSVSLSYLTKGKGVLSKTFWVILLYKSSRWKTQGNQSQVQPGMWTFPRTGKPDVMMKHELAQRRIKSGKQRSGDSSLTLQL